MRLGRRVAVAALVLAGAGACSTVVGWGCALWSPLRSGRRVEAEEAQAIIGRHLGDVTRHGAPSGIRQSGIGCAFLLAVNAPLRPPPFTPPSGVQRPPTVSFKRIPGGPEDLSVQIL